MGRRSAIVPKKYELRELVFKHGGAMPIHEILNSRQFKGYDGDDIRRLTYELRKESKGNDFGHGVEAWEILRKVIIGLEACLTQRDRKDIQKRRHAKQKGVADQTMLDNLMFRGKIQHDGVTHKEEIIHTLEVSSLDLQQVARSSTSVRETIIEHEEDFGNASE